MDSFPPYPLDKWKKPFSFLPQKQIKNRLTFCFLFICQAVDPRIPKIPFIFNLSKVRNIHRAHIAFHFAHSFCS